MIPVNFRTNYPKAAPLGKVNVRRAKWGNGWERDRCSSSGILDDLTMTCWGLFTDCELYTGHVPLRIIAGVHGPVA